MKENVDFSFSPLPLFHFGETVLEQTCALYQHREKNSWFIVGRISIGGTVLSLAPDV